MEQSQMQTLRDALIGKTWTVGEGEAWLCDNVTWTGLRCAVALNDGRGGYLDLTLEDASPRGVAVFSRRAGELLRRRAADREALIADDSEER